jgi:hypothetical protein
MGTSSCARCSLRMASLHRSRARVPVADLTDSTSVCTLPCTASFPGRNRVGPSPLAARNRLGSFRRKSDGKDRLSFQPLSVERSEWDAGEARETKSPGLAQVSEVGGTGLEMGERLID